MVPELSSACQDPDELEVMGRIRSHAVKPDNDRETACLLIRPIAPHFRSERERSRPICATVLPVFPSLADGTIDTDVISGSVSDLGCCTKFRQQPPTRQGFRRCYEVSTPR